MISQNPEILRTLFYDYSPVPTYIWQKLEDEDDYVLIDYNHAAIQITKGGIDEFRHIRLTVLYSDIPQIHRDFRTCFEKKTAIEQEMWYCYKSTAERKYIHTKYAFVEPGYILVQTVDLTDHKLSEEALNESIKQFRQLSELLPAAIFIYQDTKIVYVNPAAAEITGFMKDELLNMKFWEIIHPEMREAIKHQGLQKQKSGDQNAKDRGEVKILCKDGEVKWLYFSNGMIMFKGEPVIMGSAFDITERKIAEKALHESNERFRELAEVLPAGILIANRDSILYANTYISDYVGYTKEKLLSMKPWDIVHSDMKEFVVNHGTYMLECSERGSPIDIDTTGEIKIECKDGAVKWMLFSNGIIEYQGNKSVIISIIDMTNAKHLKDELEKSKSDFQFLYDENPAMYFTVDLAGRIISINHFGAQQLGYAPHSIIGKSMKDIIQPLDQNCFSAEYEKLLHSEIDFTHLELRLKHQQGHELWVKMAIRHIKSNSGEDISLIAGEDITLLKKTQQEKELLLLKRAETDKLATLGQFTAEITHEINNPLEVILSLTYLLDNSIKRNLPASDLLNYLDKIKEQTLRIKTLSRDILKYVKPQAVDLVKLDVRHIISKYIGQFQEIYQQKVNVQTDFAQSIEYIYGDPIGLELVCRNIMNNSVNAMDEAGTITITVRYLHDSKQVYISFRDDGSGIPEKEIQNVFAPFYTGRPQSGGTGLGLPICKQIIEQHKGSIRIENGKACGVCVHIYLPAVT